MFKHLRFFSRQLLLTSLCLATLAGCHNSDKTQPQPTVETANNVFVLNEGNYGTPNGSVSLFSKPDKAVTNKDIFKSVNGQPLGDVVQSMGVQGNRGYIVVNNSNKLEVVSLPDFKSLATIKDLIQPRYFAAYSAAKGYVTEWKTYGQPGRVTILDLQNNKIVTTLPAGRQPEQLLVANGKVFVTNSGDNTLTVINAETDAVESTVPVGDGPNSLVQDRNGRVWVLCSGKVVYNPDYSTNYALTTKGSLISFMPTTPTAQNRIDFPSNKSQPRKLLLNGTADQLYFAYTGGVYRMSIADAALPTTPLIRRSFYGLGIDPKDNTIYGGVASFTATDKFIRYQSNGAAIDSSTVGIGPNGFVFY